MRDRFSESDLLAFIEGELSARNRRAFVSRLESDVQLRGRVEQMCEQRAALRELPEPALPADFLAALEPQLARPVLMSAQPGAYRRRHQRSTRRRQLVRACVAAVLLAALFGGVWSLAVLVPRVFRPASDDPGPKIARNTTSTGTPRFDTGPSGDVNAPDEDGIECFRRLRALDPAVRVILATGYDIGAEAQVLEDEGLSAYVRKPFSVPELEATVKRVMET